MARLMARSSAALPTGRGLRGGQEPPSADGGRPRRRSRIVRALRSVAGQVFALQVGVVLLLVVAAVLALVLQSQHASTTDARDRSVAVAQTFANSPGIVAGIESPNPTAVLQPRAEAARIASGVDFIVVINTDGIRYTHPLPDRIGKKFVGDYQPALQGQVVVEQIKGTIGPLVQAIVPVYDPHGTIVGAVSAGITISKVNGVVDHQLPLLLGTAGGALVLAMAGTALAARRVRRQTRGLGPAEMTRMYEHHDAVLHAVREGVLIIAADSRLLLANDEARRLLALPADAEGRSLTALGLEPAAAQLLASGEGVSDRVLLTGDRLLVVNIRSTDRNGGPPGTVATLRDSTELHAVSDTADTARRGLKLLYDATVAVGTTLDVTRTAEELATVAVPRFADFVTVDLAEAVLRGEEPVGGSGVPMRRAALSGVRDDSPLYPVGQQISILPTTPQAWNLDTGQAGFDPDLRSSTAWLAQDPERAGRLLEFGVHSVVRCPLRARGVLLGMAKFWRWNESEPFDADDQSLAEELVARAAVCVDNARRFTREHAMAVTLQRSLLPHGLPAQNALEVAHRYLPAQAGVSGDWFDVIPLPGARVALVVGDVVGHGLHAAATMGRLRTAVHNFSTLDLPPDELLGHLDDLVSRLDQDPTTTGGGDPVTGASCLYAIYDPVSRICTTARAGHPPPAIVHPDGTVEFADVPAGPPLGLGGLPFFAAELRVPEGSRLVLYTDGLVEDRERDIDEGLERLKRALEASGPDPEETCDAVLDALLPAHPTDDVALLVARTRVLGADRIAQWEVPSDPAAVSNVRAAVSRQLAAWGLDELAFVTELILSELITNAIRYADEPIRVRLLLDRSLICEVSDSSSTSPHLRYAASLDEGGRGLFLVAQFAERWGTRYTATGKVIWAEQTLREAGPGG
ncbi:serine phosphatase RsbU (regulator of sigma subunit)/PAS domain-containing protein/anti-sigma regulatory factor (Ser/Thr protein kinase) [Kitasatospora sp. MAP12-15]|uniref:SpoIIE family protein phosphatase n=1 Tax=unclassified Kitasatospora TaxID=2633591 RepID=UPI0024767C4C|nr:SpoIIE family protein phosphatase [Kitasatospora sp. MAP12-44]MDH6113798.1 serine phosphatase RsbU (regulator of sigma subunit)/PAS domain-containing protein/anti-sigma regulatory factor (Ser/Thr protein kinase) [Kitasatospora sp. MAP12-44]